MVPLNATISEIKITQVFYQTINLLNDTKNTFSKQTAHILTLINETHSKSMTHYNLLLCVHHHSWKDYLL